MSDEDEAVDVGHALEGLTRAVRDLGTAGASTEFGALEAHGMTILKLAAAVSEISAALDYLSARVGTEVSEGLQAIAAAISEAKR